MPHVLDVWSTIYNLVRSMAHTSPLLEPAAPLTVKDDVMGLHKQEITCVVEGMHVMQLKNAMYFMVITLYVCLFVEQDYSH
jgi:hypothetical protein